jgi:hypothetical protein
MSLMIGLSVAFGAAGAATGYGLACWRALQRVSTVLQGVNPDRDYPERDPVRWTLGGAFTGAAAGAALALAVTAAPVTQAPAAPDPAQQQMTVR